MKSVSFIFLRFSNRLRSWKMVAHPCAAGTSEVNQRFRHAVPAQAGDAEF